MNKFSGAIVAALLVLPAASFAADHTAHQTRPITKWTCNDFLNLDMSFQPTAVGFADALNQKQKPEDAVLDVSGIESVTPVIVQLCEQNKSANFKATTDKAFEQAPKK